MEGRNINDTAEENVIFYRESHISYFKSHLDILPHQYVSLDSTRLSAIYFCTLGLDLLGSPLEGADRENVINYVYSNQLICDKGSESDSFRGRCGFVGSSFCGQPFGVGVCFECRDEDESCFPKQEEFVSVADIHISVQKTITAVDDQSQSSIDQGSSISNNYLEGNLAMAYTAISTLVCLEDDLSRVHKTSLIQGLKSLQQLDGSFSSSISSSECDMRFVYCACAISHLLNDWSGIDRENVKRFILSCITYEGGMGLTPGAETQGGSTYCAVASLTLLGVLHELGEEALESLLKWCLLRQVNGYNGRTNKECDSCYSFWIAGTLKLLNHFDDTDFYSTKTFLLDKCQQYKRYQGGFSKVPSAPPDILHSFYSICWLSLYYHENMKIVGSDLKNENEDENLKNENNLQNMNSIDIRFALCEKRLPSY